MSRILRTWFVAHVEIQPHRAKSQKSSPAKSEQLQIQLNI